MSDTNQDENAEVGSDCYYFDSSDPPTCESEEEGDSIPQYRKYQVPSYNPEFEDPGIELNMLFEDSEQFKSAMIKYVVQEKRNIYFCRNESQRVRVKCVLGCPFVCFASWEERYKCFQLKTCELEHQCNLEYQLKVMNTKWLAQKYEDYIVNDPNLVYPKFKEHVKDDIKIHISDSMARRTIDAVKLKTNQGFGDQFKRLRDYAQELLNSNPGSTVKIKTDRVIIDEPCTFQRMYICFAAMKRGFLAGCRRVIGLDGCFLKGSLKGELLTAIGRDANNQMYPIAWAVVEIENTDSWRWFLELLMSDLGITNTEPWTFISDQQKGLVNVIQNLLPNVEHRNCARHIHANWSKKHRGKVMKKMFWMCAKATAEEQFNEQLAKLGKKDQQAKADLEKYPPKHWSKAFMRTDSKCDSVDNNMCEAFNGTIISARSKPIIKMLEDIRVSIMTRVARCRDSVEKWQGDFGPRIMKKLNENKTKGVDWKVNFNGDDGWEVKKGLQQFKVKLQTKTCSCRSWDLSGIPCQHALCAIFHKRQAPEDFIHHCYSKEVYRQIYAYTIEPINGELSWPKTNSEEILPPKPRTMTGRPKKKRKLEHDEPQKGQKKTSRHGRIMTCSMCKEKGHSKLYCPTKRPGMSNPVSSSAQASTTAPYSTPAQTSTSAPA